MILALLDEAIEAGARLERACAHVGISVRCVQRWRRPGSRQDERKGPHTAPGNKLSAPERQAVLDLVNTPEYRDLSPKQIVPALADRGLYLASESTLYRVLREQSMLAHRSLARPPVARPRALVATGPGEVWSWDISYLPRDVRGQYFYLYLVLDVWSRRIVGWAVHEEESAAYGARLVEQAARELGIPPDQLVLHADNGGPMRGSTMLATLQRLGIVPSFSRPHQSNDNAYSESLFRTAKYQPGFPLRPFASLAEARAWAESFVRWYNTEHRHSALRFVTPDDRHFGREEKILAARAKVYAQARERNPERWAGSTRDWTPAGDVHLNPEPRARRKDPAA